MYKYKRKINSSCFVLHLSCKHCHICVINCKFCILKILYILNDMSQQCVVKIYIYEV